MELFEALLFMIVTSFYGPSLLSLSSVLDTDNTELLKACGTKVPDKVTSSGNKMTIRFRTDQIVVSRGFKATWRKVEGKPKCPVRHGIFTWHQDIKWTRVNTMQQCVSLCQQRQACRYWTYFKSGENSGYCGTMTNVTVEHRSEDVVSGTKDCN